MIRTLQHRTPRSQALWRHACLAGTVLALLTSGCAMPGKIGSFFGKNSNQNEPVRTASYQQDPIDEGPPKKIEDPIALKLGYAKWMEEIKNYPEAVNQYKVVLQERPEEMDALLGLARIDQAANRMDAAEAGFKKAVTLSPDLPAAKHALGQFYVAQERWQEALPLLNDAMLGDPANKSYRFNLAVALASAGDVNAAYLHFKQSVGDVVAHYNLGMILKSQGQYRQAEQQFLQALAKNPGFEEAKQAVAEVRQLAQSTGTYAAQPAPVPQIQPVRHQQPQIHIPNQPVHASGQQMQIPAQQSLTPRQQEQLRNQRSLQR